MRNDNYDFFFFSLIVLGIGVYAFKFPFFIFILSVYILYRLTKVARDEIASYIEKNSFPKEKVKFEIQNVYPKSLDEQRKELEIDKKMIFSITRKEFDEKLKHLSLEFVRCTKLSIDFCEFLPYPEGNYNQDKYVFDFFKNSTSKDREYRVAQDKPATIKLITNHLDVFFGHETEEEKENFALIQFQLEMIWLSESFSFERKNNKPARIYATRSVIRYDFCDENGFLNKTETFICNHLSDDEREEMQIWYHNKTC